MQFFYMIFPVENMMYDILINTGAHVDLHIFLLFHNCIPIYLSHIISTVVSKQTE